MITDLARKGRGAFFTPPEITNFIAEWALRAPSDRVLEPSCGEASFLVAAASRISELGGNPSARQLKGAEIHAPSALAARSILRGIGVSAEITVGDFFEQRPSATFDAVVGNPPYVRYQQFTGSSRARAQAAALEAGVRIDGLASSWAAFVVHSAQFLAPGGRLGLVLPGELLHVNYASPIRQFLLRRFGRVTLVTFEQRVFPEAMTEVVLLLAEGDGPSESIHVAPLRDVIGLEQLLGALGMARAWRPSVPSQKWVGALIPGNAAEAYLDVLSADDFAPLSKWGEISLGAVTGSNEYFALGQTDVAKWGLTKNDMIRISPPGSRHFKGLAFNAESLQREDAAGRATYLFRPGPVPSEPARAYIASGEEAGVNLAYKCRVRSPWWMVPLSPRPDLFFTYMNDDVPRLVANQARVQYLNSLHGVVLHPGMKRLGSELLALASLNSITALAAELGGRSYGGGILKIEPREAAVLAVPSVESVTRARPELRSVRAAVESKLRLGDVSGAVTLVDEALLVQALQIPRDRVTAVQEARSVLRERRKSRGSGRS